MRDDPSHSAWGPVRTINYPLGHYVTTMSFNRRIPQKLSWLIVLSLVIATPMFAQQVVRRPKRAEAPKIDANASKDIFFADVASALDGKLPAANSLVKKDQGKPNTGGSGGNNMPSDTPPISVDGGAQEGWAKYISTTTIEDEIKQTKLRLDQIVTTPSKFAAGGFTDARLQFSELAVLFGIVAEYPGQVRWQKSALAAKEGFAQMAANAKVGSTQAYNEAKTRLQELGDMLNGSEFPSPPPEEPKGWEQIIDRQPLMKLCDVAHQQSLTPMTANAAAFKENSEDILRFGELMAAYSALLLKEGMPDADDTDYRTHCESMLAASLEVVQAVKTSNADMARQAVGQMGQACSKCHDAYR